jgi:hypothetical protein
MSTKQDLHQIEYRHHQTRDLSPVASSMSSPDSLRAWDSRIRTWVRHPHADRLSESVCYQVLPSGQAALAWRYWDKRAAERADGTRGRPLVSRVLVGPAGVLNPEIAVALCRTGLPDDAGPMPGDVPDGAGLPTVSGNALTALTRAIAPALDRDAAQQPGLQAVVAAALTDPATPLAISIQEDVIQLPPGEGVQCPLLWGLFRIAGPLLGPVGRGWSFSTFELPLGEMDPASLPGIVFRQAQDGLSTPPARWRKEIKVRPLAPDALDPSFQYAEWAEFAGWLVAEYQERGGDGLERFITKCCAGERSLQVRIDRVYDELRNTESPVTISGEATQFVSLAETEGANPEPDVPAPDAGSADAGSADESPADESPADAGAEAWEQDHAAAGGAHEEEALPETQQAGSLESQDQYGPVSPAAFGNEPIRGETVVDSLHRDYVRPTRDGFQSPARTPAQIGPQPGTAYQAERHQPPRQPVTVSHLLKQLELIGNDEGRFNSILQIVFQVGRQSNDPNDRVKSWEVISNNDWYNNICRYHKFYKKELAEIFSIVVIPHLAEPPAVEAVARWAYRAPGPMIGGLLTAAQMTGPETWQAVMQILEPVLALRWAVQNLTPDQWDPSRAARSTAELGSGDTRRGVLGLFRRR